MSLKVLLIQDLHFGKSSLPNFTFVTEFARNPMREPALDQLHRPFDCHFAACLDQKMNVVRHDHEIVQLKPVFCNQ
jgi:hypothetical protein